MSMQKGHIEAVESSRLRVRVRRRRPSLALVDVVAETLRYARIHTVNMLWSPVSLASNLPEADVPVANKRKSIRDQPTRRT